MKTYFTSDLHLFHENIIKYCDRPFKDFRQMNKAIVENWNTTVTKHDRVFILGDVAFGRDVDVRELNAILRSLRGQKFLIKGNHDHFLKDKEFDPSVFTWVRDYAEIKTDGERAVLFHYPIATWSGREKGAIHLYGHVHNSTFKNTEGSYNVGVDIHNFVPKTLNQLLGKEE